MTAVDVIRVGAVSWLKSRTEKEGEVVKRNWKIF